MKHEIEPGWFTIKGASQWSGLSETTLQVLIRDNHIISSNCKIPGNTRGRRLINRVSLNAFIEAGVNEPPAELAMNKDSTAPE